MLEWLIRMDCKSIGSAYAGSNPARPRKIKLKKRIARIELAPLAWKARALPLCNIREVVAKLVDALVSKTNNIHYEGSSPSNFNNGKRGIRTLVYFKQN